MGTTSNFTGRKLSRYDDDDNNDRKTSPKKKTRIIEPTVGVHSRLSHQRMSKIINESLLQTKKMTTVTQNYRVANRFKKSRITNSSCPSFDTGGNGDATNADGDDD